MAKRKKAEEAGVPEWVVTYGDLMSLLLCFFILLAAFSELKQEREYLDVMKSIQEAFGFEGGIGVTVSNTSPKNSASMNLDKLGLPGTNRQIVDESFVKSMVGKNQKVTTIHQGLKFIIGGPVFFDVGDDTLSDESKEQIKRIAGDIAGRNSRVEVAGHAYGADSQTQDEDEYADLAYQRSKVVRKYLVECGIDPVRIELHSKGNTAPVKVKVYSAEEQQPNRRAEIILSEVMIDEINPGVSFTQDTGAAPSVGAGAGASEIVGVPDP